MSDHNKSSSSDDSWIKMGIPYKEFDMLVSDVDERELTQIGLTNDLEHLSVASFPSSPFPATGQIWGINIRYMIPLVCRSFKKSNAQAFNIWFLIDTSSPFTCLTVKSLEALVGQGNATHDVYNISIQDQTAKIQCYESKAHFAEVNILGADAMQILELSIEVDWKSKEFKLVKNTIVTLGVGHDVEAEKKLQALGKENVEFFGADPIVDINDQLYSELGKFFPFAVSAKSGYFKTSVMTEYHYFDKVVVDLELSYFLTEMINQTFFDQLIMDAEYAEYELFPFINRGGRLDQNDIVICQWNMEVGPSFLYGFFYAYNVGHYRLYFLNFDDEICQKKYLPKEYHTWQGR